jgi:SP family sugar:H+ symporter-like MFS transporter
MFLLPESPRYLLLKGRQEQARKALSVLTSRPVDSPEVDQECLDISMALEAETALGKVGYLDLFRSTDSKIRKRVLTGMGLQAMQQRLSSRSLGSSEQSS